MQISRRCGLVAGLLIICATVASAQEAPPASAPAMSRPIAIEIVIAQLPSIKQVADGTALASKIAELEKEGKLTHLTRLRLTTLDRQPATLRFSERVPVVTNRSLRGGERSGSFPQMQSVSLDSLGTMVECTPTLDDAGILLSCNVEQSRHVPLKRKGGEEPDGNANDSLPPAMQTLSMKSIVRTRSGESVLLGSQAALTPDGSATTVVLVSATLDIREARRDAEKIKIGQVDDSATQRVVPLARINAREAADALQVLGADVVGIEIIGVDERSKTIAIKRVKRAAAKQPTISR